MELVVIPGRLHLQVVRGCKKRFFRSLHDIDLFEGLFDICIDFVQSDDTPEER